MNALALIVVIIVEAGEVVWSGWDPCGRLSQALHAWARFPKATIWHV